MKIRNTLFLLALVVLALVYVVAVDSEKLSTTEKLERATRLVTFRPQNIGAIEITNAGELVRLAWEKERWQLESPAQDVADPVAVSNLLKALNDLRVLRPVDLNAVGNPREKLQDFGLLEPRQQVLLKGDGEPVLLEFGVEDAQGEWVYARSSRDDRIAQISTEIKEQLFAEPDSFRDPVLTRVPPEEIQGLRVKTAEGEMLLVLKDGFWQFEKPLQARADNQAVFAALQKLAEAEIQDVASDNAENLAPYGLATPRGSIQLFLEPDREPLTTIEIGSRVEVGDQSSQSGSNLNGQANGGEAEKDDAAENGEPEELVYVTQRERDAVFTMPAQVAGLLETAPNDLRDRSLLGFPAEVVNKILIRVPERDDPVILELRPAGWFVRTGPEEMTPAHQPSVQSLLKTLAQEEVQEFLSEVTTGGERYGLDQPAYELELQTSPERLALLRRQLAQQAREQGALPPDARLGGLTQADNLPREVRIALARSPEEPESGAVNALLGQKGNIVKINGNILDKIYPRPFQWRSLLLFNLRAERLQTISYSGRRWGEMAFERGADGLWQVAQGDVTVKPDYVEAAANALAQLRALDWVAPRQEPGETYGFDPPTLKVSFTISGEERPRELVIGQLVPQRGGYFATIPGFEPIFLLSLPDFEVLTAPLQLAEEKVRAAGAGND